MTSNKKKKKKIAIKKFKRVLKSPKAVVHNCIKN